MDVLMFGNAFHDTGVRWTTRRLKDGFVLAIGSEEDRIEIVMTEQEVAHFIAEWVNPTRFSRARITHA